MDIIKDIGKSLKFKERYDDLDRTGMEEYDREECKELRDLKKSGAPLSESQKETLNFCDTIRGERTRAAMNLGTAAVKVGVGAATGNPMLAMQGLGDAGGYLMSEAQEVDGPNDGVGQQLNTQDFLKTGGQVLAGVGAMAMGGQGVDSTTGLGDTGNTSTFAQNIARQVANPAPVDTNAQGAGKYGGGVLPPTQPPIGGDPLLGSLLQNPEFLQLMQQQQNPAGQTTAADTLAALANQNTQGSKLKRSTRQHEYIKGNTRGYT